MIITKVMSNLYLSDHLVYNKRRIEEEVKEGGQLKWIEANLFSYFDLLSMRYRITLHFL